jgi:hypothetical protein
LNWVGRSGISAIERRTRDQFQTTTLTSLDRALGWPLGHCGALLRGDRPATSPIITSRVSWTPEMQTLCSITEHLSDAQMRALIAKAQQMAGHEPETITFEGQIDRLQTSITDTDSLSVSMLSGSDGRWLVTQSTKFCSAGARENAAARHGDHLRVTFQRV